MFNKIISNLGRPASWQRWIHPLAFVGLALSFFIGWRYLPPYLLHNPGVQLILVTLLLAEAAHFFLHDK